jgi:hypothetical protein
MKNGILSVFLIFLGGCVLDRHEPPPSLQTIPFSGSASLVDISTLDSDGQITNQAKIKAEFNKKGSSSSQSYAVRFRNQVMPVSERGVQCQVISRSTADEQAEEKPYSVGELFLGTLVSGQAIPVPEIELGRYEKALSPHFAPGIYFMQAQGLQKGDSFRVEFSMPEEIRGISINEHSLQEGPAIFQKSEPTIVEVDAPTAPNDMNILELILITQNGYEERALVCAVYENELEVIDGKQRMEIPAAQLSGLFATPQGVMELLRINVISGLVTNGPSLRIEGVRAWVWPSWVAE